MTKVLLRISKGTIPKDWLSKAQQLGRGVELSRVPHVGEIVHFTPGRPMKVVGVEHLPDPKPDTHVAIVRLEWSAPAYLPIGE